MGKKKKSKSGDIFDDLDAYVGDAYEYLAALDSSKRKADLAREKAERKEKKDAKKKEKKALKNDLKKYGLDTHILDQKGGKKKAAKMIRKRVEQNRELANKNAQELRVEPGKNKLGTGYYNPKMDSYSVFNFSKKSDAELITAAVEMSNLRHDQNGDSLDWGGLLMRAIQTEAAKEDVKEQLGQDALMKTPITLDQFEEFIDQKIADQKIADTVKVAEKIFEDDTVTVEDEPKPADALEMIQETQKEDCEKADQMMSDYHSGDPYAFDSNIWMRGVMASPSFDAMDRPKKKKKKKS